MFFSASLYLTSGYGKEIFAYSPKLLTDFSRELPELAFDWAVSLPYTREMALSEEQVNKFISLEGLADKLMISQDHARLALSGVLKKAMPMCSPCATKLSKRATVHLEREIERIVRFC